MPKKNKLSLDSLKITSFVTSLDKETANQAKGGVITVDGPLCSVEICGGTLVCSVTHCPDPCPNTTAPPQITNWPCQSVDKGCYINTDKPCTGISFPWCTG